MKEKEKYIIALKEVQNPTINSSYDLQTWQTKAVNLITRIYGENCKQEEQINQIKFKSSMSSTIIPIRKSSNVNDNRSANKNNGKYCEKQTNEIITSFINELETFGLPEPKKIEPNGGINISLNQSQNQTVNVNIFWDSLKDELTGKQLKEVEEIINCDDKPESKKKKIFDKLKSFGTDVASNIIAGLLTNPAIYGG